MAQPLTIAIAGAGLMGRWHARYAHACGARIGAIVDVSQKAADALAKGFSGASAGTDLDALLKQVQPQIVHICTPVQTHAGYATAALQAGAHVIVEKPLATDAVTSSELICLAEKCGLLLVPVHQFLFQDGFRKTLQQIPALGRIMHVDAVICSAGGEGGARDLDEIALEILPHPFSLIERLAPGSLAEAEFAVFRPAQGEWRIVWDAKGASFSVLVSMHARPTEASMRIAAEKGTIDLDLFHGFSTIDCAPPTRASKLERPFRRSAAHFATGTANLIRRAAAREFAYPGLKTLIGELYSAVNRHGASPISAAETMAVATACDQVYARSRAWRSRA